MTIFSGAVLCLAIKKENKMKDGDDREFPKSLQLAVGAYLLIAFGLYFITFVLTRVARIKDLIGL